MQKTLISIFLICPFLFAFSQTRLKATDPKLPEVVNIPFVSAVPVGLIGYVGKFKNDDSPSLMYRSERPSNALEGMVALVSKSDKTFSTHIYPNIITHKMTIEYNLPYEAPLTFQVFDMSGRVIAVQKQQNTEGYRSISSSRVGERHLYRKNNDQ